MANYLENALINGTLRGTTYTAPTTVYVGLYTSDPTDANTGTEVSGGSYARTSVTFGAPSNGGWIGILDASTAGNLLYHTALDVSKIISSGDIFKISIGSLSVTLA